MATKAEQKRQKKRKDRERKIAHNKHLRHSTPAPRYRLDVLLENGWRPGVLAFRTWEAVLEHKSETEKRRQCGDEIAEAKVIDLDTGEVKMTIDASKPMKGALPDKLAGSPESAAKAIIDNHKTLPDNLKT